MTDIRYWIGLSLVPEVGPLLSRKLLSELGTPENIFRAGVDDLLAIRGLGKEKAASIRAFVGWDGVEKIVNGAEKKGIRIVGYHDPDYPEVLKEVDGAPMVIYMKGRYSREDRLGIAVVGSRRHTAYGEAVTRKISGELASSGFTIISGMARGIDTFSHESALSARGRTIAVLGSGLDIYYPAENRRLMDRIVSTGCGISEFPPGTMPSRENFPRRNRLISGLSLCVLVVEATSDSRSLITANYALEQNKEIFAVPGQITSRNSEGTNNLIKQGAKVVLSTEDIIEELAPALRGFIRKSNHRPAAALPEEESRVCGLLTREPKHIDLLSRECRLPVNTILNLLLSLELKGVVRQSSGKRFYLS